MLYEVCSAHDPVRSSPVHKLRDVDSWREVAAFRLDGGSLTLANLRQSFPGEFNAVVKNMSSRRINKGESEEQRGPGGLNDMHNR